MPGLFHRRRIAFLTAVCLTATSTLFAQTPATAEKPAAAPKPELKITPGQVIVPTQPGTMRRIWGELISLDPATRTGKFRDMGSDEVREFEIMPYAELLHHAAFGDLQDYTPGERAIFRLHKNEAGEWRYLTYIQDEMNFFRGHNEFYTVDKIDPATGTLTCHQGNFDQSYIREPVVLVNVDQDTKYWREGKPAKFSDLKIGDRFQTKARGVGKGQTRIAWHVFLDAESLQKFRDEQLLVHAQRMRDEGLPGYIDAAGDGKVELTLFRAAEEWNKQLKPGMKARFAPAGPDRKPTAEPIEATIAAVKSQGSLAKVTLETSAPLPAGTAPKSVARLFVPAVFEK
jgi:hypothetical protein